jgi:transposase
MIPDINVGGNIATTNAVSDDQKRRSFTPDFKQEAACLVLDQSYSVAEASRSLDVGENALRRWVKQISEERGGVTLKSKALMPEQLRIQKLEARCECLEREKSILKKVLSMSDEMSRTRR